MRKLMSIFCVLGIFSTSFAGGASTRINFFEGEGVTGEIRELNQLIKENYFEAAVLIVEDVEDIEGVNYNEIRLLVQTYAINNASGTPDTQIEEKLQQIDVLEQMKAELVTSSVADYVDFFWPRPFDEERQALLDEIEAVKKELSTARTFMWSAAPVSIVATMFVGSSLLGDSKRGAVVSSIVALGGVGSFFYGFIRGREAKKKLKELEQELRLQRSR